jgi:hypothetical protein
MADRRFDAGKLGKVEHTPQGGARVPAALTRTGVFVYRNADGSQRREYRPADEVFRADSLATLRSAPVTDGRHVWVTPDNWRDVACGHVAEGSPRQDADLLAAELVLQDANVLRAVDNGERCDLSCGYSVDYDPTPGVFNGQRYDGVQRNIRYNHVTLLGAGQGRAGGRAALRLDAADFVLDDDHPADPAGKEPGSTREDSRPMIIRFDGKDYDVTKPDQAAALQAAVSAKETAGSTELARATARADQFEAELKKLRADAEDTTRFDAAVTERVALLATAGALLGSEYQGEGKSNRDVMLDVIRGDDKDFKDTGPDGKPRSDDYVRARFDGIAEKGVRQDSIANAPKVLAKVKETPEPERFDADGFASSEEARKEMIERNRSEWSAGGAK